jgi:hypothetical protein
MKQTIKQQIADCNEGSLVEYLSRLKIKVWKENQTSAYYWAEYQLITVDKTANRYYLLDDTKTGGVVELACWLFRVRPRAVLSNLALYRLDFLPSHKKTGPQ